MLSNADAPHLRNANLSLLRSNSSSCHHVQRTLINPMSTHRAGTGDLASPCSFEAHPRCARNPLARSGQSQDRQEPAYSSLEMSTSMSQRFRFKLIARVTDTRLTWGLIVLGSPPRRFIASRIAARSTTQGTPVKSCGKKLLIKAQSIPISLWNKILLGRA
jgi:hypothetical protein